jgi:hypothetical protein
MIEQASMSLLPVSTMYFSARLDTAAPPLINENGSSFFNCLSVYLLDLTDGLAIL